MTTKNALALAVCATLLGAACPDQHPAAQQPVSGPEVHWGQNFAAADQPPASMPAGLHPAQDAMPPAMDWSGGDAARGRALFTDKCARCHGQGAAGALPDGTPVPSLKPAALAQRTERDLARHIAHGHGAMPAFMGELSGEQLKDLIAALRAGSHGAAAVPASAPAQAPAPAAQPATP
jgi:mono/diheme cytochrome c family protein